MLLLQNKNSISNQLIAVSCLLIMVLGCYLRLFNLEQIVLLGELRADALDYYNYAQNLKHHGSFSIATFSESGLSPQPDAIRPPLYPWLASWFPGQGREFVKQVIWAQTCLQIASFTLLSTMLWRRFRSYIVIPLLALLWTFPHFITVNSYFLTESLYISQLALLLALFLKNKFTQLDWLVAGLLVGCSALNRQTLEYFPVFFVILTVLIKQFKKDYVYFFLAALIPVFAWKCRNLVQIHALGDPSLMANALYHGSFPDFLYKNQASSFAYAYRFDPEASRASANVGGALQLIYERFVNEPVNYLRWYLLGKQQFLWQWSIFEGYYDIYIAPVYRSPWNYYSELEIMLFMHKFLHMIWVPFSLLYACYIFASKRFLATPIALICSSLIIYVMLFHIVVAPFNRYGIPFKLPLMILLLMGLSELLQFCKLRHRCLA